MQTEKSLPESIKGELNKVEFKVVPLGFIHFVAYSLGYKKKIPFAVVLWLIPGLPAAFMGGQLITVACLINAFWEFTSDPKNCNLDQLRLKYDPDYKPINIFSDGDEQAHLPRTTEDTQQDTTPQTQALPAPSETHPHERGMTGLYTTVPATATASEPSESAVGSNASINPTPDHFDIRSLANHQLRSIVAIGFSQSGKTTTLDQLGRALKAQMPKLQAYYFTPVYRDAGGNDERRLFDWCDRCLRYDLLNEDDPDVITAAYKEADEMLVDWMRLCHSRDVPKLFICDELTLHCANAVGTKVGGKQIDSGNAMASKFFGRLITAFNANASGGTAVGVALWGLAPAGSVEGVGFTNTTLGATLPIFIGSTTEWNSGIHKSAARNNLVYDVAPTYDQLQTWSNKGVKRIISVGAQPWKPLAVNEIPRGAPTEAKNPVFVPSNMQAKSGYKPHLNGEPIEEEVVADLSDFAIAELPKVVTDFIVFTEKYFEGKDDQWVPLGTLIHSSRKLRERVPKENREKVFLPIISAAVKADKIQHKQENGTHYVKTCKSDPFSDYSDLFNNI